MACSNSRNISTGAANSASISPNLTPAARASESGNFSLSTMTPYHSVGIRKNNIGISQRSCVTTQFSPTKQ